METVLGHVVKYLNALNAKVFNVNIGVVGYMTWRCDLGILFYNFEWIENLINEEVIFIKTHSVEGLDGKVLHVSYSLCTELILVYVLWCKMLFPKERDYYWITDEMFSVSNTVTKWSLTCSIVLPYISNY